MFLKFVILIGRLDVQQLYIYRLNRILYLLSVPLEINFLNLNSHTFIFKNS